MAIASVNTANSNPAENSSTAAAEPELSTYEQMRKNFTNFEKQFETAPNQDSTVETASSEETQPASPEEPSHTAEVMAAFEAI